MITSFQGKHAFLSNFYPCRITYRGVSVATTEHAYQIAKCALQPQLELLATVKTPGDAKRYGRIVALVSNWEEIKDTVMEQVLRIKFGQMGLQQLLLETKNEQLIEGNRWGDRYWGMTVNRAGELDGQNKLGKLLMKLRAEYVNQP